MINIFPLLKSINLKDAASADISDFVKKSDLSNLKSNVSMFIIGIDKSVKKVLDNKNRKYL